MSARWQELAWVIDRSRLEVVSVALFALGSLGLQEDHPPGQAPTPRQPWDTGPEASPSEAVLLRGWWPEDADCADAVALLARQHGGAPSWRNVSEDDWATDWRQHFSRLVFSSALAVSPPWEAEPGDVIIEPGMAFGSGDHPTTRACLSGIARLAQPGKTCLDVGCGSGVLALAAVALGMTACGVDTDTDAVKVARENAERNGLSARFDTTPLQQVEGTYDLVVANIFAEVLVKLAPYLIERCSGSMVLAGILADRAAMVEAAFSGMHLVSRIQEEDWVSLELAAQALSTSAESAQ
ncbi:MAG: ribosomal protein L11 methyltransferase [Myxococcota bacterium]|jgi:ribosomal protein L11 methyltransferase